jgi:hypothetical protein
LERLEVGVAESGVMLALAGHFDQLEADRSLARLEMRRMQVGNMLEAAVMSGIKLQYTLIYSLGRLER